MRPCWENSSASYLLSVPTGFILGGATGVAGLGKDLGGGQLAPNHLGTATFFTQDLGVGGTPIRIENHVSSGAVLQEGSLSQTVGVMAHEFGHRYGLPDLYDHDYGNPAEDSAGIGRWGLMGWGALGWNGDDGPNPFCAWSLEQLGWLGPNNERLVEVRGDTTHLRLDDLHAGGTVYKLPLRLVADLHGTSSRGEYLLLEQRRRASTYYHRNQPGEGLLIWHVHPRRSQGLTGNTDETSKLVDLICADGLFHDAGYPQGRAADGVMGGDNLDFWAHDRAYTRAHQGNWGDATDPFDGRLFRRLALDTNPSTNPRGTVSAASTGLTIELRPEGQSLLAAITQPRWAGTLSEEVYWSGVVQVDGDLTIAPQGRVVLYDSVQVRFAGRDRLQGGLDPDRCELVVKGDLIAHMGLKQAVFEALAPAEDWYGIRLDPAASSRIDLPEGKYSLRQARHGFVYGGIQSAVQEPTLQRAYRIDDQPHRPTAGNGDGQLSPGESFQLNLNLANWSMQYYDQFKARLRWKSEHLYPTWGQSLAGEKAIDLGDLVVSPGGQYSLPLGPLSLGPNAPPGEQIELVIELQAKQDTWRDDFTFEVQGPQLDYAAAFAVPGHPIQNQSVRLPTNRPSTVRSLIRGRVEAVQLLVWSADPDRPIQEIPMARRPDQDGQAVFEAQYQPPAAHFYRFKLRVHRADGGVDLGPAHLQVAAFGETAQGAALVFLGAGNELAQRVEELFGAVGIDADIPGASTSADLPYAALLTDYLEEGKLAAWLGGPMSRQAQQACRFFLQHGGRLLVAADAFARSPDVDPFMREMFRVHRIGRSRRATVRTLDLNAPLEFTLSYAPLQLLEPAQPILLDPLHQAAGMRLDTGIYRLVFMAFNLHTWEQTGLVQALLEPALVFLQHPLQKVALEVGERDHSESMVVLSADRPSSIRATIEGPVRAVDLLVRSLPDLEMVAVHPMQQVSSTGAEQIFATDLQLPSAGPYRLSLWAHTDQGRRFPAAHVQVERRYALGYGRLPTGLFALFSQRHRTGPPPSPAAKQPGLPAPESGYRRR